MNKLNELIEQQKFKEIISLYADSKDIEEMFAYALALAIEGDVLASNEYFKKHYEILIKQPVRLINSHVNIFLYYGQFKNAKEVVEYYEDKPYISQEVEETFIALKAKIEKAEKDSFIGGDNMNIQTIKKYLLSKNDSLIQKAVMSLKDYRLDTFISILKDLLVDTSIKPGTRMLILMYLKIENYNKEVQFYYYLSNSVISVIPSEIDLIDYQSHSLRFAERVNKVKNPSITETFYAYLQTFDMMFFPFRCEFKDESIYYALMIYCYKLFDLNYDDLNEQVAFNNVSSKEIEEITRILTTDLSYFLQ